MVRMVKNLSALEEIRVWSLSQEDPLKNGMATHSSIHIIKINHYIIVINIIYEQ